MNDHPTESRDRTAELEARIAELERRSPRRMVEESRSGLETAFWAMMHTVFPEEARGHLKKAGREQLLAARVYLDRWIARLDSEEESGPGRSHEKIDIE